MTQWTDDELAALLSDTFLTHERLADPSSAVRIARDVRARRRHWPVAVTAAASIAVLVGGIALLVDPARDQQARPSGPSRTERSDHDSTRSDADNLRDAAAESTRVLRSAPLPEGTKRIPGRPEGWPAGSSAGIAPSDRSLTRTAWYAVTAGSDQVEAFFEHHIPHGMDAGDGSGRRTGVPSLEYTSHPREPAAYTGPTLVVQWYDLGDRTAIRLDAMLASRRAQTSETHLDGDVTSVDVVRTVARSSGGVRTLPRVRLGAGTERDRLDRFVTRFNALNGAVQSTSTLSCPAQLEVTRYRVTFRAASGVVTYDWSGSGCDGDVAVTRDGHSVGPDLDPGGLAEDVRQILALPSLDERPVTPGTSHTPDHGFFRARADPAQ